MTEKERFVLDVIITPEYSPKRRYRYTRRDNADGYWRTEAEWTGCRWRIVGREPLTTLTIESVIDT